MIEWQEDNYQSVKAVWKLSVQALIQQNTYLRIEAFMRNDLNLKGNELIAYSLIYGFQKNTGKPFDGSQDFISEWLGISRSHVSILLQNLADRGLLKINNNRKGFVNHNSYECTILSSSVVDNSVDNSCSHVRISNMGCQKIEHADVRNSNTRMLENLTVYNRDTIEYNSIHNDIGRTEFSTSYQQSTSECLKILCELAINRNQLHHEDLETILTSCLEQLHNSDDNTPNEVIYGWNSYQNELERQGREPQFMPNLRKWLANDAVRQIKELRRGKWYSMKRVNETVSKLLTERELV